jgi:hypothetical protein
VQVKGPALGGVEASGGAVEEVGIVVAVTDWVVVVRSGASDVEAGILVEPAVVAVVGVGTWSEAPQAATTTSNHAPIDRAQAFSIAATTYHGP